MTYEEYLSRPMTLDRIDMRLFLGDCEAVNFQDEWLRAYYKGGMNLIAELMNDSSIGTEISELEQYPPQTEKAFRAERAYTL
jgi:hypothetical protein